MNAPLVDTHGLLCAFQLVPTLQLDARPDELTPTGAVPLWMHFNLLDNRTRHYLEHRAPIPDEARGLLVETAARVQLQIFGDGFAAVLGDLHHDFNSDPEGFGTLRVYVDPRVMITCRAHRVTSIDRLRVRLLRGDGAQTPVELFEMLVHELVEAFAAVSTRLNDTIEDAEDEILAGRFRDQAGELGRVRRLLARLRRHVNANRSALFTLPDRIGSGCDAAQRQALREVIERLDAVGQDLELVTERARLLQEEIAGRQVEATNRNLYVLSIVTTALLPITLITGIFGMNVGGLPFYESKHGFWAIMVGIVITVIGTMALLRKIGVLH